MRFCSSLIVSIDCGIEGRRRDIMLERLRRGGGSGDDAVICVLPPCSRMRGSRMASARSEISTPITVRKARNIRNEPARYMSWLFSARMSSGPVVSSDSTMAVISAPEMIAGRIEPISEMKKLSAMRSGYLTSALNGCSALGARRDHILLLQLVEQIGPEPPDHAGRAGGADDDDRNPQMREDGLDLRPAHRLGHILRIHEVADRGAEPDIGEIHEDQRQHEIRNGETDAGRGRSGRNRPSYIDASPNRCRSERR